MHWQTGLLQQPWQANLERFLGLSSASGLHLPAARLLCAVPSHANNILCADPIHLQADRDTAKLIPAPMLSLSNDEEMALMKDINVFLEADEMLLTHRDSNEKGARNGWYLSGRDGSQLESCPPSFVANRNASAYLPEGEDSGQWRRLMTELQMLLHAHPVNEQRVQSGKLPINSLWFWGGGAVYSSLEKATNAVPFTGTIYADDDFTCAVCVDLQLPCKSLAQFDPLEAEGSIVIDTRIASAIFEQNEVEMNKVIAQINEQWLEPVYKRVHKGEISQLLILNEDGDKGALTRELLLTQIRSKNPILRAFNAIKLPEFIQRLLPNTKGG